MERIIDSRDQRELGGAVSAGSVVAVSSGRFGVDP
jgi:hypothetical protein